jgi:hypothetical protein
MKVEKEIRGHKRKKHRTRNSPPTGQLIEFEDDLATEHTPPVPLNMGTPTPLEDPGTFKGGDLAYGQLGEGLAMQHVENLEAEHTPTPLADLAIAEDDDLDYGPRGEGLIMQLNHGYISHLFKDNQGRVAILTTRANPADHIVFREKWDPGYVTTFNLTMPISGFGVPTGHPTCRFTDVTNDIPLDDDLGEAAPAGLSPLA